MSGAKILIVEDEWLVAQGISENLQDLGYEVTGLAPSGEEALRLAAERRPDLVVMDILLQGDMDGIDAAEHLRQRFNLPVVFLTAYADAPTLERAKVAEPYGYILKPFEVRELHSAVEIALYKSRAEKRLQHVAGILRAIRNVNQLIVQEKDRGRLIQRACQLLTEGRGYFTAWIALVGQKGQITAFAVDGEENDTARLRQMLRQGEMPRCSRRALGEKDLLVIEDLSPQTSCFLWENYQDRGVLVTPLLHEPQVYGILGVLLPVTLARDEEELSLFQEVAADLSLALFNLDLEEREQHAQEALSASEEKFRQLVENASQIILVAQGGHIKFANPIALENSGYSLAELTSRPFLEFVHPDDREVVSQTYTAGLQGRAVPATFFCRYFTKNGALRWAEIKTSDITWEGQPAILNCISDITDKKEMVEVLRQSEERFRMFFEKAPIGYQSLNDEGLILEVNPTWLETLGYAREEAVGRWFGDFLTPEHRELFPERFTRFKTLHEVNEVVFDMVKKDGRVITVSFMGRIALDDEGGFRQTHCVFTDITERKRAEKTVQEGIRLNQLLLDSLPCVAMLIRPYTREIVAANEAAVQVGAVPGAFCYATFGQRQDSCPFCLAPQVWETGQSQHLEVEALDKVWDAHWVPIKEDLYLHYAFDITARKETERTQKMLEAQLIQAQKMEALGTLAGGIAHDFNNILGAMLGFAELAYIGLPENSEEGGYLQNLLKAGDRARSLVKQILSFSRQEKAARQPLSLAPIIKETLKFLRASLPTTIEIKTRLYAGKAMVVADPTQIHQILLNLATNAAHAMEEKGGMLEIGLKVVQISPEETSLYEVITPGPYLELRVSDTGHGMEPEIRERIFEPFFTTKEPWKGTGMGLAVVYGIVKSMEGTIKVTSQPGSGTTFRLLLPIVEVELAEAAPEILAPLSRGVGRILFVDDDADFFQAGQRMLMELGYEVAAFDSSHEALRQFQAQPRQFDLLICDQTMPGLTGLELAAACSRLRPDLPIILCTGFSETVTPERVRAAGVNEVVTKPFDLRQIGERIKKILKKNITKVE